MPPFHGETLSWHSFESSVQFATVDIPCIRFGCVHNSSSFQMPRTQTSPRPCDPAGPIAQWLEPAAHNGLVAGSVIDEPLTKPIVNQQRLRDSARKLCKAAAIARTMKSPKTKNVSPTPPFACFWHPILRRAFDDYFAPAPLMAGCVDDQVLRPAFDWRLRQAAREDCENEHAPEETKKEQRPMLDSRRIFRVSV